MSNNSRATVYIKSLAALWGKRKDETLAMALWLSSIKNG